MKKCETYDSTTPCSNIFRPFNILQPFWGSPIPCHLPARSKRLRPTHSVSATFTESVGVRKPQQGAVGKACLTVQGEIVEGHVQIIFWGGLSFVVFFVHDSWGLKCLPLKMLFDVPFLNYRWAFWRHVHVLCEHRSGHCKPKAHQTSTLFVLVLVSNLLFVFRISSNIARDSHDAKIAGLYSLEVFVGSSAILLLPPALTVANIFWLLLGTYSFVSALSQNGGHASIAFYHFLWGKKMRWLFYDWG